jgi:hypothetical protein
VCLASIVVYRLTAYPTITWWNSSECSLAAVSLGISTPPGSFLLTILGWFALHLPVDVPPAQLLNLLAGALASVTAMIVYFVALRLIGRAGHLEGLGIQRPLGTAIIGAAYGALTFAWSRTLWEYAVQFTPYILTTVFTALIVWAMVRWWEGAERRESWLWLVILGILFGLDFSVHRTNLLLLPGLFFWILMRRPRTLLSPSAWIAGASGLIAGLAFHLLIIPVSAGNPVLNAGDPSNWSRFYAYVSLNQYGGGWLVKFYPRNGPLWDVQAMDLIRAFGVSFLWFAGKLKVLGVLPALFGLIGLIMLWLRNHKMAAAFVILMVVHAAMTVLYFNIPENFFRSLHRHYLPVFVIFAVFVACGMGVAVRGIWKVLASWYWPVMTLLGLSLALVPASQLLRNWHEIDSSGMYFTEDYAANTLNGLPRDAILFTNGDNDTWPLWYMQAAHSLRPDVRVLNMPLLNTTWFVDQLVARDPEFPLSLTQDQRHALRFREWPDTTVLLPVSGAPQQFGLPDALVLPGTVRIDAAPAINDQYCRPQDELLLDMLVTNHWHRPLCFAVTVAPQNRAWLEPYCRLDGLFWRVVPYPDPPANTAILRGNLFGKFAYRGFADPDVRLDDVSRQMASNYYHPFMLLADDQFKQGDSMGCVHTREQIEALLPPSRLEPGEGLQRALETLCRPTPADSPALHP